MDGDGTEDLVVLSFEKDANDSYEDYYRLKAEVYTIQNGTVYFLDKTGLGPGVGPLEENTEPDAAGVSAVNTTDLYYYVNAVTDGANTYILVENTGISKAFADGIFISFTAFQLKDGELKIAFSFEQSAGGSSGFAYMGYDTESRLLYNSMAGIESGEKYGEYNSYEDALEGYFDEYGIVVKAAEPYSGQSVSGTASLKSKIFSYQITSSDTQWDENGVSAKFTVKAYDGTNLRE